MRNYFTRRSFLGLLGLGGLSNRPLQDFHLNDTKTKPLTVLFQGDSITDGNRGRSNDPNHILGHGFVFAIASQLGASYPERQLTFINKGVSGDTIEDLHVRWKTDTLDLKPSVINILVGVNNVLSRIRSEKFTEPSTFQHDLATLITSTQESLPGTTIVLCEPFILPVGMVKENQILWQREIKAVQEATSAVASTFNCIHVRFQQPFTDAIKKASAEYWIWDGIHPTYNGHGLMAHEWMKQAGKIIPELRPGK